MIEKKTYPSIRTAACAVVHGALRVAQEVVMRRATLSICRVLLVLPLRWQATGKRPGHLLQVVFIELASKDGQCWFKHTD